MTAVYIHIPFCRQKCPYCSFPSFVDKNHLYEIYAEALIRELDIWGRKADTPIEPITSLFLGGGTPTVFPAQSLGNILASCFSLFGRSADAEISIEANPGTVDEALLDQLCSAGVNRVSFGIQSFSDRELSILGRIHDSQAAVAAVKMAQETGFENINIDLMYGIPGQTASDWQKNVEIALGLQPQHLSMYQLTLEEGTPFAAWFENGRISLPAEEDILAMDAITKRLTNQNNLQQYEISNWAEYGKECRHNQVYWRNEEYIGAGAGAVSYWSAVRQRRIESPQKYIQAIHNSTGLIVEEERLDNEAAFRETVIMGLRMVQGVNLNRLKNRFGIDPCEYYRSELPELQKAGLLRLSSTHLALTAAGMALANTVMAKLV